MVEIIRWLSTNWTTNTDNVLRLVVVALACWRLSNMLVKEDGPFGIFTGLRRLRGIHMEGQLLVAPLYTSWVCLWCMSVWVAVWLLFLPWQISVPFAISAVAILVHAKV